MKNAVVSRLLDIFYNFPNLYLGGVSLFFWEVFGKV